MVSDPHQVLGVSKDATQDEIKKAYRKKAKECHPDLHPDDPDARRKMQDVNEAYDMLMNPGKYQNRQQQSTYQQGNPYGNPYGQQGNPYGQQGNPYGQQGNTYGQQGNPYGQQGNTYGQQGNPYGQQGNPYGQSGQGGWYDFEDLFGFGGRSYNSQVPPPREEPGDSEAVRRAVYLINSRQYSAALNLLNGIPSTGRNARWYYLCGLAHQGMGNTMAAMEHMQRAVQLDPNNSLYHQLLQRYRSAGQTYEQNGRGYSATVMDPSKLCMGLCLMQMLCRCCWCC